MEPRLVRWATAAAERLAGQDAARENARVAATALARGRVDRIEVEHFLDHHVSSHPFRERVLSRREPHRGAR
ncbi:hypothetical protein ACT8ZV_11125 [Nocardioides sp. MAHUQ-72]|uniref:hypothetical protein n=1 Tax=unclassified Nocardioides TaxID=2615069 RepID=UPI003614CC89